MRGLIAARKEISKLIKESSWNLPVSRGDFGFGDDSPEVTGAIERLNAEIDSSYEGFVATVWEISTAKVRNKTTRSLEGNVLYTYELARTRNVEFTFTDEESFKEAFIDHVREQLGIYIDISDIHVYLTGQRDTRDRHIVHPTLYVEYTSDMDGNPDKYGDYICTAQVEFTEDNEQPSFQELSLLFDDVRTGNL